MRVLVAHNRYQLSGGEDAVVRDEVELLRRYGHDVEVFEENNDAIHGIRGKLIASSSVFYSVRSRRRMANTIRQLNPEIVHIHNWFPMLSPSIIQQVNASGIPVIQTLHNFRMLCANALLYRNGAVCMDCMGKALPVNGILHGCYRGSRVGSAIVTSAYAFHRMVRTWDCVDLFIAVSDFEREMLIRGGLPAEKIVVKPNFIASDKYGAESNLEDIALYVGRLSPEKGICTLLSAWNSGKLPMRLKIIGDGPLAEEVRSCATRNSAVQYMGLQPPDTVYREMAKAKFLVFPSECFETFGRTVAEAFSQGTPVLASDLGAVRELVEDGVTGYRFSPGDSNALIEGALRFQVGDAYLQMRSNCRNVFLNRFTAEMNCNQLIDIYSKAIKLRNQRRN
ncbi:MAG: glycosyltransferase family 4 protein [Terracidiphilus sp.]